MIETGEKGPALLRNNRGVALILVLMIATIALAVTATLLYIISVNSRITGVEKRYETALDAAEGIDGFINDILSSRMDISGGYFTTQAAFGDVRFNSSVTSSCWTAKMLNSTARWDPCSAIDKDITVSPTSYDFHYSVGGAPQFEVYAKIVNTVEGNTAPDLGLRKAGVVNANPGEVPVQARPYMYMIEGVAINNSMVSTGMSAAALNSAERARISLLYQY